MITIKQMKKQMDIMGITNNGLKEMTRIGYATISDLMNGKSKLERTGIETYETIVNTLFTPYEQYVMYNAQLKCIGAPDYFDYWYEELIKRKFIHYYENHQDKLDIQRSGAQFVDEEGNKGAPPHIRVTMRDVDGHHTFRIFEDELYRKMNNAGKKLKKELVYDYLSDDNKMQKLIDDAKNAPENYAELSREAKMDMIRSYLEKNRIKYTEAVNSFSFNNVIVIIMGSQVWLVVPKVGGSESGEISIESEISFDSIGEKDGLLKHLDKSLQKSNE